MSKQIKVFLHSAIAIFVAFLCFFGTAVAQSNNYSQELYPLPAALRPNVEFWKNVYAVYSERDVVIHDSEDLGIVYEVVNLDSLFPGVSLSPRLAWKKIEAIKKGYSRILLKLSRENRLDLNKLYGDDKRVALLFRDDLSQRRLRRAARRVRGQSGLRERFLLGLQRSGLYLQRMRDIFRRQGLPLELLVLPHVESSFNYKAYSKFGAAGVWQFTRSTGRQFMKVNYIVDERLDPIIATEAAAKLLKRNHEALGSWPLAITAYNHGRSGMLRAKRKHGDDLGVIVKKYRSRSFGFASRNFYAEFLAALQVATGYRKHFGDVQFHKPARYIVFHTPDYITVRTLLDATGLSPEEFSELNPALRQPVLSSKRRIPRDFPVRVPLREELNIEELYTRISSEYKFDRQVVPEWHKVRRGETLTAISRRYRIAVDELMALNNIRNAHRIYVGQNLQIPTHEIDVVTPKPSAVAAAEKEPAETQLADATVATETPETVLDAPVQPDVAPVVTKTAGAPTAITSEAPVEEAVEYVSARPLVGSPDLQVSPSLKPHDMHTRPPEESVEEIMAMALPDYHVVIGRDMRTRVVRAPQVESLHETFRDLGFPQNGQVTVEPDETLGHFADWLEVPTWKIRNINKLSYAQPIQMGQSIWLTFESVTPEEFHRRRLEYHQGIEEDFYLNFTIAGEKSHVIRRGESVWYLCNRIYEIPFWLLEKYNPGKDLLNLAIGEELIVPIVEAHGGPAPFSAE